MKRTLVSVALLVGACALLEWVFAYVTEAEGLFSPKGSPNAGALAIGVVYLGLRILVRALVPALLGLVLAARVGQATMPQLRRKCRPGGPTPPTITPV